MPQLFKLHEDAWNDLSGLLVEIRGGMTGFGSVFGLRRRYFETLTTEFIFEFLNFFFSSSKQNESSLSRTVVNHDTQSSGIGFGI
jgi:hypothetical protein